MDFEKDYATEESCRDLIKNLKWPKGFFCAKCKCESYWDQTRNRYTCTACKHQHYLLARKIHNTNKSSTAC